MKKYIIVAMSIRGGIGINNSLPWKIKKDLKYFRELTNNQIVVMGRKTYESIPNRPLKNRLNVVLTRYPHLYENKDCVIFVNETQLNEILQEKHCKNIFFIGGKEIYEKYIHIVDGIYATQIYKWYSCDVFFPKSKMNENFVLINGSPMFSDENEKCAYQFEYWEKKYDKT